MRTARCRTHVLLLEQDVVEIHRPNCHVRFLGATIWTNFALYGTDEINGSMSYAHSTMNDYSRIRRSDHWSKSRHSTRAAFTSKQSDSSLNNWRY